MLSKQFSFTDGGKCVWTLSNMSTTAVREGRGGTIILVRHDQCEEFGSYLSFTRRNRYQPQTFLSLLVYLRGELLDESGLLPRHSSQAQRRDMSVAECVSGWLCVLLMTI